MKQHKAGSWVAGFAILSCMIAGCDDRDSKLSQALLGQWVEKGRQVPEFGIGTQCNVLEVDSDGTWVWQMEATGLTALSKAAIETASSPYRDSGRWSIKDGKLYLTIEQSGLNNRTVGATYKFDIHSLTATRAHLASFEFYRH